MFKLSSKSMAMFLAACTLGFTQAVSANGPGWGPLRAGPGYMPAPRPAFAPRQARIPAPRPWTKRYVPPAFVKNYYRKQLAVSHRPVSPRKLARFPVPPARIAKAWPGPQRLQRGAPRPVFQPPMWTTARYAPVAVPGPYRPVGPARSPGVMPYPPRPLMARTPVYRPRPPAVAWQQPPLVRPYPPQMAQQMPVWRKPVPWRQARLLKPQLSPRQIPLAGPASVRPPPGPYVTLRDRGTSAVAYTPGTVIPAQRDRQAAFGSMVPIGPAVGRGTSG